MSQKHQILSYMRNNGSITPIEALNECGCFQLAARINEIRNEYGYDAVTMVRERKNGKTYGRYYLAMPAACA